MPKSNPEFQKVTPPLVGEVLPHLLEIAQDRRGADLVDAVIPSAYGDLYFDVTQHRDGTTRWVTDHGEVVITCDIQDGTVVSVDTEAQEELMGQDPELYSMGMKAFAESLDAID